MTLLDGHCYLLIPNMEQVSGFQANSLILTCWKNRCLQGTYEFLEGVGFSQNGTDK